MNNHCATANSLGSQSLLSLVLASLVACGGGASPGNSSPNGSSAGGTGGVLVVTSKLSGTVRDKAGVPIAGVSISVFHHNENSTVTTSTDANGAYAVTGLSNGNNSDYEIFADKPGFGFYPAVADPAGTIAKFDFNGLYRTVIRFISMPARDVANANFTAYRPGDKQASLPRTGQTTSYASGDDYAAQKGVAWPAQRFSDNLNGTVTDHLSGLIWLKNAACFGASDWSTALTAANQLASGSCGLSDGSKTGEWRMPNINELESLVDVAQVNPALSAAHPFTNLNLSTAYWSSTTYTALPSSAMAIRFSDGRWINGIDAADGSFNNVKTTSRNLLWAVKSGSPGAVQLLATGAFAGPVGGGAGQSFGAADDAILQIGAPLTSPRFIDKGDGTLADTVTGLTWLKQADCFKLSWSGALAAVNNLAHAQCGLTDGSSAGQWRLPNRSEMLSLSDRAPTFPQASYLNGQYQASSTVTGPVIFKNFIVSDYYWTSSTSSADTSQAWSVYSCDFGVYNLAKSETRYALAVR